ncbi:MAG: hypothetical protein HXS53_04835 [Theionarchaea archaeon]|nr:hypothetical protein [Theionarchaea archaeon]
MECLTCKITEAVDKTYPVREAIFGKTSGRCLWHCWDDDDVFVCSQCKTPQFFEKIAWCSKTNLFICTQCSSSRSVEEKFWCWKEYTLVSCPFCGEEHPTLNRQEYDGAHPWQADPFACKQFPVWYPGGNVVCEKDLKRSVTKIIRCPYCKGEIHIKETGTYTCPHCHRSFTVKKK